MPARAEVTLVLALAGCDVVLGLKEQSIPEAGTIDGGVDAEPDEALPCDADDLADDEFTGAMLRPDWELAMNAVTIEQNDALVFTIPMTATPRSSRVRSLSTVGRDNVVSARLSTGPTVSSTHTSLSLLDAPGNVMAQYDIVYNAATSPANHVRMLAVGAQPKTFMYSTNEHVVFGIYHDDAAGEIVFTTSSDGNTPFEQHRVAASAITRFHVELSAGTTSSASTQSTVVWDDLRVTCR